MRAVIETQLARDEPSADQGLVTWFDVRVLKGFDDNGSMVGRAGVARVHVGRALDVGESLLDVPDVGSAAGQRCTRCSSTRAGSRRVCPGRGERSALRRRAPFGTWLGGRNIDLALARRLRDTLGQGCKGAVIRCSAEADAARWERLGFTVTARGKRYLHLPLGSRQARVAPNDDFNGYKIVANPPPGRDHH